MSLFFLFSCLLIEFSLVLKGTRISYLLHLLYLEVSETIQMDQMGPIKEISSDIGIERNHIFLFFLGCLNNIEPISQAERVLFPPICAFRFLNGYKAA